MLTVPIKHKCACVLLNPESLWLQFSVIQRLFLQPVTQPLCCWRFSCSVYESGPTQTFSGVKTKKLWISSFHPDLSSLSLHKSLQICRSGNFEPLNFQQTLLSCWMCVSTEEKVKRLLVWNSSEVIYTVVLSRAGRGLSLCSWKKQQTRTRGFGRHGCRDAGKLKRRRSLDSVWTTEYKNEKWHTVLFTCSMSYVANYSICLHFIVFTLVMLGPAWLTFSVVFVVFWSRIWLALGDGCLKWAYRWLWSFGDESRASRYDSRII